MTRSKRYRPTLAGNIKECVNMTMVQVRELILCVALAAALSGCVGTRLSSEPPPGVRLEGTWKLNRNTSDDPQKVIDRMRAEAFERIRRTQLGIEFCQDDPYCVLGVSASDGEDIVKAAYRKLVRENHPDRLMAEGLPQEAIATANAKLALLNTAWETIRAKRGWK